MNEIDEAIKLLMHRLARIQQKEHATDPSRKGREYMELREMSYALLQEIELLRKAKVICGKVLLEVKQ